MDIPPERMFEMKASEKTTELNAYVTGFGGTKRVVVWDTTMEHMTIPQTLFVFGHEMGHYVLGHIPKELTIVLLQLLVLFYLGYRLANWMVAHYGARWGIRDLSDWTSLPLLVLMLFQCSRSWPRQLSMACRAIMSTRPTSTALKSFTGLCPTPS
jgi:Zn-dependent protease with chaperone function